MSFNCSHGRVDNGRSHPLPLECRVVALLLSKTYHSKQQSAAAFFPLWVALSQSVQGACRLQVHWHSAVKIPSCACIQIYVNLFRRTQVRKWKIIHIKDLSDSTQADCTSSFSMPDFCRGAEVLGAEHPDRCGRSEQPKSSLFHMYTDQDVQCA